MALYKYTTKKEGDLIRFQLKDQAGRIVASGTGATVSAAQQDALESTTNEGARVYLGQMHYPDTLTE